MHRTRCMRGFTRRLNAGRSFFNNLNWV
jgi:hypothetical protein